MLNYGIGDNYPITSIRGVIETYPVDLTVFKEMLAITSSITLHSFWTNKNIIPAANQFLARDVTPSKTHRAFKFTSLNYRMLGDIWLSRIFVVSPIYKSGYIPAKRKIVPYDKIEYWNMLLVSFI